MTVLPRRPSDLLSLALDDLIKTERDRRYRVEPDCWFHKPAGRQCIVRFAGVVMAKTLGASPTEMFLPEDFTGNVIQLHALDLFRIGRVEEALDLLGQNTKLRRLEIVFDRFEDRIANYPEDPRQFKVDIRNLIVELKKVGL